MTDATSTAVKKKRFRSPPYPAFGLERAVERVTQLHRIAQHYEVGVATLQEAWGMKSTEGQVWRTAAALIQYGLLTDSGSGKNRKFKVSDAGRRIVLDTDPASEKRKQALKSAALRPMIHGELWEKFGPVDGIADSVLRTHLTIDRVEAKESPYSETAASEVIETYRNTLAFAGLTASDKAASEEHDAHKDSHKEVATPAGPSNTAEVKVGDYVKWTSGGVDQFKARQVTWVSDDKTHIGVFGSPTGIPTNEVEVVPAPNQQVKEQEAENLKPKPNDNTTAPDLKGTRGSKSLNATGYVVNGRLQLTADVDADEIDALKDMLNKYQEILRLMS